MKPPNEQPDSPESRLWPDERIVACLLGDADADSDASLRAAIQQHPALAARVSHLQSVLTGLEAARQALPLMRTTPAQRERLAALAPSRPAEWLASAREHIRQLVALLTFDSRRDVPTSVGFRGGSDERVQRFEFDGGSVEVRIAKDRSQVGRYWLHGQLEGVAAVRVGAASPHQRVEAPVAPDGYFELAVDEGEINLEFAGDGWRVVLPPVAVMSE